MVWGPARLSLKRSAILGISREFEVVETVRRVIALEEDQAPALTGRTGLDPELDEWEVLEQEDSQQPLESYAELVQLSHR